MRQKWRNTSENIRNAEEIEGETQQLAQSDLRSVEDGPGELLIRGLRWTKSSEMSTTAEPFGVEAKIQRHTGEDVTLLWRSVFTFFVGN